MTCEINAKFLCMLVGCRFTACSSRHLVCTVVTGECRSVTIDLYFVNSSARVRCSARDASGPGTAIEKQCDSSDFGGGWLAATASCARWVRSLVLVFTHILMPSTGLADRHESLSFRLVAAAGAAFSGRTLAYVDSDTCTAYTHDGVIITLVGNQMAVGGSFDKAREKLPDHVYVVWCEVDDACHVRSRCPTYDVKGVALVLCRMLS